MKKTILSSGFRNTAFNQLWRIISGPIVLLLIPLYLSPDIQGYWYTFISLAALAIFADMGFSTILLQFSAHEYAHLKLERTRKILIGDKKYLVRLATLWHFAMRWSVTVAFLVFPIILFVGYLFLMQKETKVAWFIPWIIYGLTSVIVFINSMVLSFIEGCNKVGEVQKIRFLVSVVTVTTTIILLISGAELFSLAIAQFVGTTTCTAFIIIKYRVLLSQLNKISKDEFYPWKNEILPLLWRYAISWISGYFIFQVFTPIAFHYYGAVEAGKIGLTIAICTAIFGISNVWMTIITPKINILIAHKDYKILDVIFKRHLLLSILTYILGIIILLFVLKFMNHIFPLIDRIVSFPSLVIISVAWLFQLIINSFAVYMRAHKEEPLFILSFLSGLYIVFITVIISKYLSFDYFFMGFLSSYIFIFPWVMKIFYSYKRKYS